MTDQMTIAGFPLVRNFKPVNMKVLLQKNATNHIIAFEGEWKGRKTFNIMTIWLDNEEWAPGKGVQVPLDKKGELIKAIASMA